MRFRSGDVMGGSNNVANLFFTALRTSFHHSERIGHAMLVRVVPEILQHESILRQVVIERRDMSLALGLFQSARSSAPDSSRDLRQPEARLIQLRTAARRGRADALSRQTARPRLATARQPSPVARSTAEPQLLPDVIV